MISKKSWQELCSKEIGKPYIWGADGPDSYDCSGFVQWALQKINLDPSGDQTSDGLYRYFLKDRSDPVKVDRCGVGDIVFFGTDEAVTHIALAWGDGNMLEAGGGGRNTTTVAIARQQGAEVRIRPIARRHDLVAVLRPRALPWSAGAEMTETLEAAAAGFGHFQGEPPVTQWLGDGRNMRLVNPFGYMQESGLEWPVPAETVIDGASIPRVFWSLIGGPFEGLYRNASIVHDHYCDSQTRPWRSTHQVFYDAMRCSGVDAVKAKIMYYAVYRFGPRWTQGPSANVESMEAIDGGAAVPAPLPVEGFDPAGFSADARRIAETNPDIGEIEALADAHRAANAPETAEAIVATAAPGLDLLGAEVALTAARRPLIEQLVDLQESSEDELSAAAVGAMLMRYGQLVRDPLEEELLEATAPSLGSLKAEYEKLFATCVVRPERKGEVAWHRKILLKNRKRYEAVQAKTDTPWWFIGVVHALEASFNFGGHLHNGDPLAARTVQVPKGRPKTWNPPNDWESSAVDAIAMKGFSGKTDWSIATALYRWESYNGWGYHPLGMNSPYLWSFSNHYTKGKFVKDHVFDANAVSKQCGAAVMLRALLDAGDVQL